MRKIPFPKPDTIYFGESKRFIAQSILNQMLESGNCATPCLFLDKNEINRLVETSFECGKECKIASDDTVEEIPPRDSSSLATAIESFREMALVKPVGCLIHYSDEDTVCLVGSGSIYYVMDLTAGVFCQTDDPLKCVAPHIQSRGDGTLKCQFFTEKSLAVEPKKKKVRVKKSDGATKKKTKEEAETSKAEVV